MLRVFGRANDDMCRCGLGFEVLDGWG
ncbi:hypothetical protein AVEN_3532-1, partial [Araneus ventricosus]